LNVGRIAEVGTALDIATIFVQEFSGTPSFRYGAKIGLARSPTKGRSDEWANRGAMVLLSDKWAQF